MDPVVEDEASEAEEEERHWVTGIGWKPGPGQDRQSCGEDGHLALVSDVCEELRGVRAAVVYSLRAQI